MNEIFISENINDLELIAQEILQKGNRKIAFFAGLGAGKTTLIKILCRLIGIPGIVTSPTFTIMNHYFNDTINVFHFDFYRIKKLDEIYELGYEEYFFSDDYVFIE